MKLAEISIKRPSLVIVLFTILLLGGLFSYSQLGYELIPKFETNVITVATIYPGASPSEVENTVTKKIEDAIASLENIKKIITKSSELKSLEKIINDNNRLEKLLQESEKMLIRNIDLINLIPEVKKIKEEKKDKSIFFSNQQLLLFFIFIYHY